MEAFQQQWKDQAIDGKNVLSSATSQEISRLCKHIEKGCLSGIQPGRGTNKNEALHKSLNAHFKASRYGVELAYMLLTTSFYQHNENVDAHNSGRKSKLIMEHADWLLANPIPNESYGIMLSANDNLQSSTSTLTPLSLDKASYHELFSRLTSSAVAASEFTASVVVQPDENPQLSIEDSTIILLRAISWFSVYHTVSKYSSTSSLQCTDVPFMKADFGYSLTWFGTDMDTSEENQHVSRLSDVLTSWNFQQVDGDCLFTSVALHLHKHQTHLFFQLLKVLELQSLLETLSHS